VAHIGDRTRRHEPGVNEAMSTTRLLGFSAALVLAALIGGTIMSAVSAAPAASEPTAREAVPAASPSQPAAAGAAAKASEYCATFRAAFAKHLGVEESALGPAAKAAAIDAIDAAVAAGDLTAAVADKMKERVNAAEADGCAWLGRWAKRAKARVGWVKDGAEAAATALGMTVKELRTEFRAGNDLKEVAAAKGVDYATVSAAIVKAVKADLDAAVAAGTIKQERADRILARLETRLANGWTRTAAPAQP
jgi:hypothetical protein